MSPGTRSLSKLLAGWLLLTSVGCTTLNLQNLQHIDLRSRRASARNPVVKIVCILEPAEGRDPKGVPCQGFAGQVLFLTRSELPVSVDGEIRIYEFDNQGNEADQSKPLHTFDFDGEAWSQHYHYGTLGPAYSVFIPYMRRGISEATCAIRVRLKPKEGPAVFSEMTEIKLVGFEHGKHPIKTPVVDRRVESTTPEDLTSVNKRRRTTTIALNGRNGSVESLPVTSDTNPIQQAAFEIVSDTQPMSSDDARNAQMEQMVKELRAMQKEAASAKPTANPAKAPRLLEDTEIDSTKIRTKAAEGAVERKPEPVISTPNVADDLQTSTRIKPKSVAAVAAPRHPLEDDKEFSTAAQARRMKGHPLANEELPSIMRQSATAAGEKSIQSRHPLDDSDVDEPVRNAATRKTGNPSESIAPSNRSRSESYDPFDPIDTEAIETTAVEETPSVRRKLRAANQ